MKLGAVSTALGAIGALCLLAAFTSGLAQRPVSEVRVELGRRLFYDADLSIDGTLACATCHEQHHGFTDGNATRPGVHGDPGRRNIQTLANVATFASLTWGDPRVTRLEDQALIPIAGTTPVEMGFHGQEKVLEDRIGGQACYRKLFAAAFPGQAISMTTITKALAAFQRTMVSRDAPYDRKVRGEAVDTSIEAVRGETLFFGKAGCATCHAAPDFTDATKPGAFHRIDLPFSGDQGLGEITGKAADNGKFRTPSLRNVAISGPYLHDGSARTLQGAIRRHRMAMGLKDGEVDDLAAFLRTLTDDRFVADPRFSLPKTSCEADAAKL
ncbi:cytochrome c peroxidase [Caulobacter sp.]|uniref:cytochrome-c peroxidase n=1 Tax=Caulobacter sp. TaxID=78 RepID=UPI001B246755|nr:cytochrome c peroxidase [Caulobacter sp.]MBO9546627.1 c-type cytochrome [Caulobacter sp.]